MSAATGTDKGLRSQTVNFEMRIVSGELRRALHLPGRGVHSPHGDRRSFISEDDQVVGLIGTV
jgi:hypothetical protein